MTVASSSETSTRPYAARADGEGNVHVFHRFDAGLFAAAVPRSGNAQLLAVLRQISPSIHEAATVFQTSLQNGNPVIHPAVTLMNAALLERTGGDFRFYEEGVTASVGRVMEAVDNERLAIAATLGVTIRSEPDLGVEQGYMTERNYTTGYSRAPSFLGIKAPATLASRYLTEQSARASCSSRTSAAPGSAHSHYGRDHRHHIRGPRTRPAREGARTMRSLGVDQLSTEQLLDL
jgi:opine dehydrogenase